MLILSKKIQLTIILTFSMFCMYSQSINFPPNESGKYTSYTSKSNTTITVGDKIELGLPYAGPQFVFINQNGVGINANLSGSIVEIVEIEVSGNQKRGFKAYAKFKGYGAIPVIINLEPAINSGEIIKD